MKTHAEQHRYNEESVTRALDHHKVTYRKAEWREAQGGKKQVQFIVDTGVGEIQMNLRDAYFFVVGNAEKERTQLQEKGVLP